MDITALLPYLQNNGVPMITTGLGTVAQGWGMLQGNKAMKRFDQYNTNRMNQLDSWFNREYYQNYLNSATAKSALARLRAMMNDRQGALKNTAVAGGATPEAVIAGQGDSMKMYNDAINALLGMGDQRRDQTMYRYQGLMQPLQQNQMNSLMGKVNMWNQFGTNVTNSMNGLNNAWANSGSTPSYSQQTNFFNPNKDGK